MNLTYVGAVRTPLNAFHYAGHPFSCDFQRREYVLGKSNSVGRLTMVRPALPKYREDIRDRLVLDLESVPVADWADDARLIDPSNNSWKELTTTTHVALQEVCVLGDKALVAGSMAYFAGEQPVSWIVCDWPSGTPVTPWRSIAGIGEGWAAGPMTVIPERFREALQGDLLFGQPGGLPIVSRQSYGFCGISAYARDFLTHEDVPARLLLGYHDGDLVSYNTPTANDYWNFASAYTAIVFIEDCVVFLGSHGYGPYCYGHGVSDPALRGTRAADGQSNCVDPIVSAKGTHAYPYRVQGVRYRVSDLAEVRAGRKRYNALRPVDWFEMAIPWFDHPHYTPKPADVIPRFEIAGADYDSAACELHVTVKTQDSYGYEPGPLVHVFTVNGVPAMANPQPPFMTPIVVTPVVEPPIVVPPSPSVDFSIAALNNEIAMLKAELHEANDHLTIVESQRVALAGQLQQVRAVVQRMAGEFDRLREM